MKKWFGVINYTSKLTFLQPKDSIKVFKIGLKGVCLKNFRRSEIDSLLAIGV
jgi:hypothetical protein